MTDKFLEAAAVIAVDDGEVRIQLLAFEALVQIGLLLNLWLHFVLIVHGAFRETERASLDGYCCSAEESVGEIIGEIE